MNIEDVPGIRELWEYTLGDPAITIGLVEGPPELSHPCFDGAELTVLEPAWLPPIPVVEGLPEHATFVASVLFGQSGSPVHGLAPRCRGIIVPALRDESTLLDPLNAVHAIEALVEAGADIVHFAASHPTGSGDAHPLLARAVHRASEAGVLVVAPAGNDYGGNYVAPACLPQALAVGAFDDDGVMYRFSNWGERYAGHGIVAPGGNVTAAAPGGETAVHKGTSVAAPIVTGTVALLASLRHQHGLPADPLAVRDALLASAVPCEQQCSHGEPARCLAGKLNVSEALRLALPDRERLGVVTSAGDEPSSRHPVYAIGVLGYDFGTEAHRDTFKQLMAPVAVGDSVVPPNPYDARQMVDHLTAHPSEAKALIWTLNLELTPIYAIEPLGPYAAEVYELLTRLLSGQVAAPASDDYLERVAQPGTLSGRTIKLFSGQVVPIIEIEQCRGIYGWEVNRLTDAAVTAASSLHANTDSARTALRGFLNRIYYDLRNLGAISADRALNFAATNAFQAAHTFATALAANLTLDTISVEKSPFCRQDSDCWDVKLRFFDPENTRRAKKAFRFTVDVSDTLPVTLGDVREWSET